MILGIEQPRVAGLRREENQLTKRDDTGVRFGCPSDDVINLAQHQIRLGWIQPRMPRVSAFLRPRGPHPAALPSNAARTCASCNSA
jgi:hypothetical protein